jgi:hypothetical protein
VFKDTSGRYATGHSDNGLPGMGFLALFSLMEVFYLILPLCGKVNKAEMNKGQMAIFIL